MDRFLNKNGILRIVALVLSCIIWLTVSIQGNGTGTDTAPASQKYPYPYSIKVLVNPDLVVTRIDNPTAVIQVQAQGVNLTTLPAQMLGVGVEADARGLQPGTYQLKLTATGMPPLSYTIEPGTVTVTIDKKVTETKDVKVDVQGNPVNGYNAGTPITDLQSVEVSGVKAAVDRVAYVEASVSIQAATETLTKAANLKPVDSSGNLVAGVEVSPVNVTVTVPVQSPQVTASVAPQVVGTPASGFAVADVTVSPQTVRLQGTPSVTSSLLSVNVPIDVGGLKSTQTLHVKLPLRSGLVNITPDTITVTVKIEPAETKTFTGLPIAVENLPPNGNVTVTQPQTVDVTLTGPKSVVDGLQAKDVTVYIDGSHLTNSDTSAELNVTVPNWVQVTGMSDRTAQITVTGVSGQ